MVPDLTLATFRTTLGFIATQPTGELFQLFFTPAEIAGELASFHSIEDLGSAEINARYFRGLADQLVIRRRARTAALRVAVALPSPFFLWLETDSFHVTYSL